jgi:hypothetical protein
MKKIIFSLSLFLSFSSFVHAQWTTSGTVTSTTNSVGIGTAAPASNLHVSEPSTSKPGGILAPTKSVFKLSRYGTPTYSYNESAEFRIGHGGAGIWGSQLDLFINGGSNINDVPDQQAMTWLYNGNVGIGTTTPAEQLDVSNATTGVVRISSKRTQFQINDILGKINFYKADVSTGGAGVATSIQSRAYDLGGAFDMDFVTGSVAAPVTTMTLHWNGNVGIGVTNPTDKLAVNGTIHTKEVRVDLTGWADYVFKQGYHLLPLIEVKDYIDKNHHLPDMPSEKEVIANGLNLGEMNKVLTKKVEELTLYLIEENKKNAEQKELIQMQEIRLQKLEKLISLDSKK